MSKYAEIIEPRTVKLERVLPGPIERVWSYLTDADKRATWFAGGPMELHVGGKAELHFNHANITAEAAPAEMAHHAEPAVSVGHITQCEPLRLLAYTWWEDDGDTSEIIFQLQPKDEAVLLTLTHKRLSDRRMQVGVSAGWHAHLGLLEDRLLGREPGPFWSTFGALKAEYDKLTPQEELVGNEG